MVIRLSVGNPRSAQFSNQLDIDGMFCDFLDVLVQTVCREHKYFFTNFLFTLAPDHIEEKP